MTGAVFLPSGRFDFINWDDPHYFRDNANIRGLGLENVRWFFTTTYMGHYQPLNWLSYAVDYAIGGLDAGRFHRTQTWLHAAVAAVVCLTTAMLLRTASPSGDRRLRWVAAAFAGLFFGLHPLRIESVAWVSARADILAAMFYLLAVCAYVSFAARCGTARMQGRGLVLVTLLFIAAVLSKEMAVTLPFVLVILDVYPLRRLPLTPARWGDEAYRGVWREKGPWVFVAVVASLNAFRAAAGSGSVAGLDEHPVTTRLAQAAVSIAFYPIKTLLPTGLNPLREMPIGFSWLHPSAAIAGAWIAVGVCLLVTYRRRIPGLAAAAAAYVVMILPVSGLMQRGAQMVAERYSYLSCIPFAMVLGYSLVAVRARRRWSAAAMFMAAGVLAALAYATRAQLSYWRDSETLWQRAVQLDATSGGARAHLAHALRTRGETAEAETLYRQSLSLGWRHPSVYRNLAAICQQKGRWNEAIEYYLSSLRLDPNQWECHFYLAATCEAVGNFADAAAHFAETIRLRPGHVDALVALGRIRMDSDDDRGAEANLQRALALDPVHAEALERLSLLRARAGDYAEAVALLDRCIAESRRRGDDRAVAGLTARRAEFEKQRAKGTAPATQPQ